MGAQKKFKNNYPLDKKGQGYDASDPIKDKKIIEEYRKKIDTLLEDPDKQKKAALIISKLINSK